MGDSPRVTASPAPSWPPVAPGEHAMNHREGAARSLDERNFDRILIIKPSSLGDVIHGLPILRGLRERFPNATIDWMIASGLRPLLEGHPDIDELVSFDRKRYARVGRSFSATWDFIRFLRDLRARRYDLVIDLQGLLRSGFMARVSGAPVRIGPAEVREGAGLFYTHRARFLAGDAHAIDRNLSVGSLLGFDTRKISHRIPIRADERDAMTARLHGDGLTANSIMVVVAPGARWETKRWTPDRFAQLIDFLQEHAGVRCVLLGGPEDNDLCRGIASQCRQPLLNLAGQTSVREFAAAVSLADLVVCHDSSAAHLAVAFDRPLVCITGPTDPKRTGPYRRLPDVVQLELDCSPCFFRRLSQCPHEHRCMRDLNVESVLNACRARIPHVRNRIP